MLKTEAFPAKFRVPDSRVVVSITTFSARVYLVLTDVIRRVMEDDFDRLVITIPLIVRNETGNYCPYMDCIVSANEKSLTSIQQYLSFFEKEFGPFKKILEHPQPQQRSVAYESNKIYLQFLMEKDYGPATKLLGALLVETDPSTIIIAVDDDSLHYKGLITTLAGISPPDAILSSVCQFMGHTKLRSLNSVAINSLASWFFGKKRLTCHGWFMGCGGVAYRVGLINQTDIFREANALSRECFLNDDVWLSGYLTKKMGIPLQTFFMPFGQHNRHASLSLSTIKNAQDDDLIKCAKHYGY